MSYKAGVRYRINARDEIIFVDENWDAFAKDNDGAELVAHRVLGRVLWEFITDKVTRQLYQQIVARVRQGHEARLKLRCDGPSQRRYLEMTIRSLEADLVEFATRSIQVEERSPIALLARQTPRSRELLRACAWCNRLEVGTDLWAEAEVAVEQLKLFETEQLPRLTHGMCSACFATVMRLSAKCPECNHGFEFESRDVAARCIASPNRSGPSHSVLRCDYLPSCPACTHQFPVPMPSDLYQPKN